MGQRTEMLRTLTISTPFILGLLLSATVQADPSALQAMDDAGLEAVSAQQGIAFDLEYRINSKADGEVVDASECPNVGVLTGGSSCRIAYSLADSSGMWIVMKGYRGLIKLTNIRIDATNLAANWTVRTDGPDADSLGGDVGYQNPYLNGYDPRSKPSLQLTAGNWATALAAGTTAYNTYLNQASYTDFTTSMYVERLTAEYDSSSTVKDGYLRNQVTGAPIALRIAHGVGLVPDPNNPPDVMVGPYGNEPARVRLDGRLQIYGFGY